MRPDGAKEPLARLGKHLNTYTAKNEFDYFIHKHLGDFLSRELDFYLKNEVMHLDDIDQDGKSAPDVERYLDKLRAIRRVGHRIIDFLAQLEDFQKRLWLKKKFVVETHWCVTLDRVPEELYEEIAANDRQREEWVRLFSVDEITGDMVTTGYSKPLTVEFLRSNPYLVVDTSFFHPTFTARLLASVDDVDGAIDGVLIHSENVQALALLLEQQRGKIDALYLDPPYNTDAAPISYKNGYPHSSWLALMNDRLSPGFALLSDAGLACVTIDDTEIHRLRLLTTDTLAQHDLLGVVAIKNNPAGRTGTVGFAVNHEYALFFGRENKARVGRLEHSDSQKQRYKERDDISSFEWTNFRKHGGANTFRTARPRQFYPIYVKDDSIRIPAMTWNNASRAYVVHEEPVPDEQVLFPVDQLGRERIWDFVVDTARANLEHLSVRMDATRQPGVYRKWRLNPEGLLPQTWWDKSIYSAVEYGTELLANMLGETHAFTFPKSVHAVADCLRVAGMRRDQSSTVLDYFAGSGTTAHAVINLNREDGGQRKYILVEMGDYFDQVLKPRVVKAVYSTDWKNGKPISREGVSQLVKVIRLESYEDTLNNLDVRRTEQQQSLLDSHDGLRDEYMLRYWLGVETRGSASLLDIEQFDDPWSYTLNVARGSAAETRPATVDLVETFNYLIGLRVRHVDVIRGVTMVQGALRSGEKALVIWRKVAEMQSEELERFLFSQSINPRDMEFDVIYVNGDNHLENTRRPDETWKVRLIEEEFLRLMFETADWA